MKLDFPSRTFDEVVAAACHGTATEAQMRDLHERLLEDPKARDEYLLRVELHARLASEPDLFARAEELLTDPDAPKILPLGEGVPGPASGPLRRLSRRWCGRLALAAGVVIVLSVGLVWSLVSGRKPGGRHAVAMLNRAVNARWHPGDTVPRLGAPLEPGRIRLQSGLAQVVFYNGARVVIEGPADLQLVSSSEAICTGGRLTAEVPPQARGFRVISPNLDVTDLGTSFGLNVGRERAEVHVFSGLVEFRTAGSTNRSLAEGRAAVVTGAEAATLTSADRTGFASLFELQSRSVAADAARYDQWREANRRWNRDESMRVHLDFEQGSAGDWRLSNAGRWSDRIPDAVIIGCQWVEGRWATKPALEFRGVSDRIRLKIPGEADSVTLAAWVRVQGLDRQINSLFMADGFAPGTLHWVLRHDGVLGLTVIGARGAHQILVSPPVMTVEQFGLWTHLAVVLDGEAQRATHYVNGQPVSRHEIRQGPPYLLGASEIGNWNPVGFPGDDPFLIRNFSGVFDEFSLFDRALSDEEIRTLFADGKPQTDPPSQARN